MRTLRALYKDGSTGVIVAPMHGTGNLDIEHVDESIDLKDINGKEIYVNDVLYYDVRDWYFTIFKVPGGYGIESNPESFGIYDPKDPFPVYESTADPQMSAFIRGNLKVIGNTYDENLMISIKLHYERKKENRKKS